MNCQMGAWVIADDADAARLALAGVEAFMRAAEATLSRFLPTSALSQLNARLGQPTPVVPMLWEVLTLALDSAQATDGLYDPTILDALEAAGYDRSFEQIADTSGAAAVPPRPIATWRDIQLDPATRTVTLPPGLRVDLGGIAKGWAAERAADSLARLGSCLVDAGGDLAARGHPVEWSAWPVGVADPRQPDADLALLMVADRGVATSGTDYRRWRRGQTVQHHLIDPRTRRPAQTDLLSVTVVAPTAIAADLHAKLALLQGAAAGLAYLEDLPDVEGLLISEAGDMGETSGFQQYVYRGD